MTPPTTTLAAQTLLIDAAVARRHQLEGLPPAEDDQVVAAQRVALTQTLEEIEAAQRRVDDGTYGRCVSCQSPIPTERLELRPWTESCIACAARREAARRSLTAPQPGRRPAGSRPTT